MANKTVFLNNVRMYWGDLFTPAKDSVDQKTGETIKGKYSLTAIFAPDSEAGKTAQAAFVAVAAEEFGPNWKVIVDAIGATKKCVRNGAHKLDQDGNVVDGFDGMLYISAKNTAPPAVVDEFVKPIPSTSGKIYRGCVVNAKIEISAFTSKNAGVGRCISAKVLAVQYAGEGEAFGSAPPSADGFAAAAAPTLADVNADTAALFG